MLDSKVLPKLPDSRPARLLLRSERRVVPALFVFDLPFWALQSVESVWKSYRTSILQLPADRRSELPEHLHWDWVEKRQHINSRQGGVCAITERDQVQGMAMYGFETVPGRRAVVRGKPFLYVEYLETAPFNLAAFVGSGARFSGVGTELLSGLQDISERWGCEGRLALHSLPGALGFYEAQGFQNLGCDPEEELDYLELTGPLGERFTREDR